jgi:hypothetical protein
MSTMTRPRFLAFLLLALAPPVIVARPAAAAAADADPADTGGWVLTTADFRSAAVTLKSIDPAGVRVAGDAGQSAERVVDMDDFLQLERPMPAAVAAAQQGKFVLHLAGGDQVAGEPASVQGEQLVWNNAAAGEVRVPLSRAVAITRPGQPAPERRPTEDVVTLANGDAVRGIVAGIEGGKISVQRNDSPEPLAVPVDSIASVQFAATGGGGGGGGAGPRGAVKPSFRLRLGDGSSLPAATLTLAGGKLSADLGDGKPRPFDLSRVAAIEQVNGPAGWLTDRQPAENVYVPYFGTGQDFPTRMNPAGDGGRELRFGGKSFRRGIGVHAYSRLVYPLDGQFAAFRVQYAVDERMARADMTVRIKLDDKVVHEKQAVRGGTLSPVIFADLAGAKKLTLEVDYGGGTDVQDRLVWLEPALLRHKPAEEPATPPQPARSQPAPAAQPAPGTPAQPASTPSAPTPTPAPASAPTPPPAKAPADAAR